jgi:cathepsin L
MKIDNYLHDGLLVVLVVCFVITAKSTGLPAPASQPSLVSILLNEDSYSFEQFLSDFGRFYHNKDEYLDREAIFYENLHTIVVHNNQVKASGGKYWMGINPWADRRSHELLRGYDKRQGKKVHVASGNTGNDMGISAEQRLLRRYSQDGNLVIETSLNKLGISFDAVEDLPKSVDWRMKGVTTPVKSQGMCGSCWAFASTAVLESHISIQTGVLFDLSPQELVSCARNPYHCGGSGGCTGATAEIAFDLVKDYGIVQEWQFGYRDGDGTPVNCTLVYNEADFEGKAMFNGAVAGISDYVVLPTNNYTVLMNVVAKLGPVAVSVACLPWHLYHSGIFYEPLRNNSSSTDINHLVVLEGYGFDDETSEDYWIVRNSWGPRWGELGYIRLKRVGEEECAWDMNPDDGAACTLDPEGNQVIPLPQYVCGNSGILFDTTVPLGVFLV